MARKPPSITENNWLQLLVFHTGLFEHAPLTPNEQQALTNHIRDKKPLHAIAKELLITEERAVHLLDNAIGKLLLSVKSLLTRGKLLDTVMTDTKKLKEELAKLRVLSQAAPIPEEVKINPIQIQHCRLTVRTKKILAALQITYVAELSKLSREKLRALPHVGIKTLEEIVTFAEDCGIRIR